MAEPIPSGPHAAIAAANDQERCLVRLFDRLWVRYRERVEYVRRYEQVVVTAAVEGDVPEALRARTVRVEAGRILESVDG